LDAHAGSSAGTGVVVVDVCDGAVGEVDDGPPEEPHAARQRRGARSKRVMPVETRADAEMSGDLLE
jgi:hypothetical protein